MPKEYIPGVEKGINSVMGAGILAGFPVVDVKATLIDGAYHDVDSSALAFEIASRAAFREGLQKGGSVLLEPIMKVEVVTPEEHTGYVMGDLLSRRGHVQGQDMRANAVVINAMVPLANMFGYVNKLRSGTQGRASFTMQFDHYEQVPPNVAKEIEDEIQVGRAPYARVDKRLINQHDKKESGHGQGKIFAEQAALQHRHDRSRRPRQDVADGGDHQGSGRDRRGDLHGL